MLIYNDGRLPETWTVDDLFAPHTSKPYNPLLAGAFFRSGQIEAWGRGIEKITEACKYWGKPEPFFRLRVNEVMIGFNIESQFGEKFGENIVNSIVENIVDSIAENIVENIGANAIRVKILELMRSNPKTTAKAIAQEIGIAPRNVQVHIQSLKEAGHIERVGAAKGGHWVVKSGD